MSDKKYQYKNIENNKSLINKIPNQSDIEGFEVWKKKTNSRTLENCIFFGGMGGLLTFPMISAIISTGESLLDSNNIIVLVFLLMLIMVEVVLIKNYLNSRKWQMEYCNYGKVIDKYCVRKGKRRRYYIIVSINDVLFKIRTTSLKLYRSLESGDDATVFSIEGKEHLGVMKK